jgi:hypothetical protein
MRLAPRASAGFLSLPFNFTPMGHHPYGAQLATVQGTRFMDHLIPGAVPPLSQQKQRTENKKEFDLNNQAFNKSTQYPAFRDIH